MFDVFNISMDFKWILVRFGGLLGTSWGVLGRLGGVLGRLGAVLGRLGASWAALGASWGDFDAQEVKRIEDARRRPKTLKGAGGDREGRGEEI